MRRQGLAGTLCEHSQLQAVTLGFTAMQYNLVVAINTAAIRVWERQGFADGLVMFKTLLE